jgi:hypothetical protein
MDMGIRQAADENNDRVALHRRTILFTGLVLFKCCMVLVPPFEYLTIVGKLKRLLRHMIENPKGR